MEKTPLISVIVPVYRTAKEYCMQCIDSIRNQSYPNWEVLIIDDGNTPEYATWLDIFSNSQIRVIHQKNGGVSAARNRGGAEAKGEWIYYCDPDDWMHKDELSILLEAAITAQADIAVCKYTKVRERNNVPPITDCVLGEYHIVDHCNRDDVLLEMLAPGRAAALHRNAQISDCALRYPWAHLYKADLAKSTQFLPMHPGEDRLFNMHIIDKAKRMVFVFEKLHYYRLGTGVTSQLNQRLIVNSLYSHRITFEYLKNHSWSGNITREINKYIMNEIAVVTKCILNEANSLTDFLTRLQEYITPEIYQQAIQDITNPYYTRNQHLLCILYRFKLNAVLRLYWRLCK